MTAPAAAEKTKSPTPTPTQPEGDDSFIWRHLGPRPADVTAMLQSLGYSSLEELTAATVPASIRLKSPLNIGPRPIRIPNPRPAPRPGQPEQSLPLLHWHGLLRHHHSSRHPAQHP